jgi:hypothetical protein
MDLLTIYTHYSESKVITALSLISILYKLLHAKYSPACSVFTSRSLATASNSGDSSAFRAQVLSSQLPVQNCLSTDSSLLQLLVITSLHRPHRKHRSSIVAGFT